MTDNIWRLLPFKFTEPENRFIGNNYKKGKMNPELPDGVKTMN
jgi:hypothetical protein